MTSLDSRVDTEVQRQLLARLPVHMISRDDDTGGELRALLSAVAAELELLEDDIRKLYDAWFVETCDEWLLPYLADLIGLADLPPPLGPGTSRRALVANTVGYRRRKGSASVLQHVATDVTGWPTEAVQFFKLMATTVSVNDVHLDRPATVSVRDTEALRLARLSESRSTTWVDGLDRLSHIAEVRRIDSGRGRYNLSGIGIFVHPIQVLDVGSDSKWSRAREVDDGFTFDPLGRPTPLFAPPDLNVALAAEHDHVEESALPVPLSPHRLLELLERVRYKKQAESSLPLGIRVKRKSDEDLVLLASATRVCGLEDLSTKKSDSVQAMVDPISGRFRLYRRTQNGFNPYTPRSAVMVRYSYGAVANLGAGTYDRLSVHEQVLASDPFEGSAAIANQIAVAASSEGVSLNEAFRKLSDVQSGTLIVSIVDNAENAGGGPATVPEACRLVVVAAAWPGQVRGVYAVDGRRAHVSGDLVVKGEARSSVVLDGLLLDGDLVVQPGVLGSLTICQCTVTGTVRVSTDQTSKNADLRVRVVRSQLGGIDLADTVPSLAVTDSIIGHQPPIALHHNDPPVAMAAEGTHATFEGVTVLGLLRARSLDASSCIFEERVDVVDHQIGCLRYSYVAAESTTPRRFRCVSAESDAVVPVYSRNEPGAPDYLALSSMCPREIRLGGEDGTEMGSHNFLRRPLRVAAAQRQLAAYLPAGREVGIFGS
jgi:hypothetical protein